MSVYAVICEYNPFHYGHKYLIEQIKNDGDAVVSVMSGSFTQRGDAAICDKFTRAKAAVQNGSDLVIELPTVYACAPAETFASGAIDIISSLGTVDKLCFGAEADDIKLLKLAGKAFEDKSFNKELKKLMDSGEYYPKAVQKAMKTIFSPSLADIIDKPNNILAIEYLKAIEKTGITPVAVKRKGASHDSGDISGNITSAKNIRELIKNGSDYSALVPNYTIDNPADIKKLESAILYKLRTMSRDEIKKLPDVKEGLENRISDAAGSSASLDELLEKIKTKRYTMARIRRILISAILGITSDMPKTKAQYIRVLAFNERGAELMKYIKEKCPLSLITNVADGYNSLDEKAKRMFDTDLLASDIFALATENVGACGKDFTYGIIRE